MKVLQLFLLFILFAFITASAQLPVNIDQLSDQQLKEYLEQAKLSGLSDAELEAKAKQRGLSQDQIAKIRVRIAGLSSTTGSTTSKETNNATVVRKGAPDVTNNEKLDANKSKIFGAELFNNTNLTFQPNLKIPAPRNYVLGVGDEIQVDVFGVSDAKYNLRVSEEGLVRIPYVSPIKLTGLTFEDAEKKIKQSLTKIYPEIATGKTSLQVSLGQIRTIRITLIGEVSRPGTYEVTSLTSMANALYISGGPNDNGSFRDIQLIRNGKIVAHFDLYDFLLKGDLTNNKRLEDDDIIKITPYAIRVELKGALKRQAVFEAKPNETLGTLVNYAGGFTDEVYKEQFKLIRIGTVEKEIKNIPFSNYPNFQLQSGDVFLIDNITNRFKNRVSIQGAVFHPGDYALESVTTLKDLLDKAKLKEEVFLKRGIIRRLKENFVPEMIDFNVKEIITGTTNMNLQKEDNIQIFSLFDVQEKYSVSIAGEVNLPGTVDYTDSMKLQDLIVIAGGFKDGASAKKIDISRRIKSAIDNEKDSAAYAIVQTIVLNKDLTSNPLYDKFTLLPFDVINVRKDPNYQEQISVFIQGEVVYPGEYVLQTKNETISDLVKRAGGLKTTAYPASSILLRNTFRDKLEKRLAENKTFYVNSQSKDSSSKEIFNAEIDNPRQIVNIHLDKALETPHKESVDIVMEDGDILRVPKYKETVQTFGGVYVPRKILYGKGLSFKDAINESGGFLATASKRKVYVQYANGEVKSTKSFLFFRTYPKIEPGSEVYVPLKREKKPLTTGEIIGIASAITGMASIVFGIINLTR
jgi:protein involved in polysaccharide export with SLBB domain